MARIEFSTDIDCARALDADDELASFRRRFHIPRAASGAQIYLCGHSLGLMPRRARANVERELERWQTQAVDAHFATQGWVGYHERFADPLARLTGAWPSEVVAMNSLTLNLHLMLVSFYRPTRQRSKILVERDTFPSDRYAIESQLRFHGLDPATSLVELGPDESTGRLSAETLQSALEHNDGTVALVLLPGVQYLSGEALDIASLTAVAQRHECMIGFDLAHAIGNVALELHDWNVDFAVWCSYKYLNGGPGAIGGCFVHSRHGERYELPRFAGWWGHDKSRRFLMEPQFRALAGAEGWQISNPPILAMAPLDAALRIFSAAGLPRLRRKSAVLTGYLEYLLAAELSDTLEVLTPTRRGAQLSMRLTRAQTDARAVAARMRARNVRIDVREPDVLRLAPVPLYNRYLDVFEAVTALKASL
jgi:kynureninase